VLAPTGKQGGENKMEVKMKICNEPECGGKMQPHTIDAIHHDRRTDRLDCDGPCSERRIVEWKNKPQA